MPTTYDTSVTWSVGLTQTDSKAQTTLYGTPMISSCDLYTVIYTSNWSSKHVLTVVLTTHNVMGLMKISVHWIINASVTLCYPYATIPVFCMCRPMCVYCLLMQLFFIITIIIMCCYRKWWTTMNILYTSLTNSLFMYFYTEFAQCTHFIRNIIFLYTATVTQRSKNSVHLSAVAHEVEKPLHF